MDELNAAPSSTEPTAEELASIAMGTNAQEAGMAAQGELTAAAPDAGAAADFSAPSGSAAAASSTLSPADAPEVAQLGEFASGAGIATASRSSDAAANGSAAASQSDGTEGAASGEGVASAAGASSIDDSGSATAASIAGTSSPIAENSLDSLPSRVAQHLESIYAITVEHVRQLAAPGTVAKAELAVEIDDLLHKLSNGIAVSDGRIVAKLAALRSML
ncbi:hypothetical protein [Burkholderia gladioli]|uniref:hypothetical protein n=1 Tax=Burkholderia gladioli TaxID=28095 RepID=UPI001FC7CCD0|nr:hypothetical protein [Burkholderia gladioli]